jgi:hypothetical protein
LGLVAQANYDVSERGELSPQERQRLATLADYSACRPDFLSWHHRDFPAAAPILFRHGIGLPVLSWTIRAHDEQAEAKNNGLIRSFLKIYNLQARGVPRAVIIELSSLYFA